MLRLIYMFLGYDLPIQLLLSIHQLYFKEFSSHISYAGLKQKKLLRDQNLKICEDDSKTSNTEAELQSAASIISDTDNPASAAAETEALHIECASKIKVSNQLWISQSWST